MENVFLVCFFVGLFFTVVSAVLAGVFGGHGHGSETGVDTDVDVAEVDVGDVDAGDVDVGDHDFHMGHDFDHSVAEAGGDGHVEVGATDSFPGLSPWSPTVLCSFLTTFGGVGYISLTAGGIGVAPSILSGLVIGFTMAFLVFWSMNKLFSALQSSSEVHVADLVGREAEVITPIPAGGVGEISYRSQGTRLSAPARTVSGKAAGRGAQVKIVRIAGPIYYVKPVQGL